MWIQKKLLLDEKEVVKMKKYKISMRNISPYVYLVPSLLIFGIFLFYPFFKTIYLSLYKTNKMGQARLFVWI